MTIMIVGGSVHSEPAARGTSLGARADYENAL
jgi:hypothetical protein